MFQIEKNVQIPNSTAGRPEVYPFSKMEVGDSFLEKSEKVIGKPNKISLCASAYKRRTGKKFTVRYVEEEGGYRCWRVS